VDELATGGAGRGAVLLLSGGLDSATVARAAQRGGWALHALTFRYGQRHVLEVEAARRFAAGLPAASHRVVEIDLGLLGGSALTDPKRAVPKGRAESEIGAGPIPETYVPARNTVFLSYALGLCEVLEVDDIFLGVNALDYSGYPDCRPEYLEAFERLARLATRAGVEGGRTLTIHAPLLRKTKAEIIRWGVELGVDHSRTWSCYDPTPDGRPCGACDSCLLRKKGFREAGVEDHTPYAETPGRRP
jgi:7-cyano-7-deazaguanine synthase